MYDRGEIMSKKEQATLLKFIYNKNFVCSLLGEKRADFQFDLTTKNIPIELLKIKQRILERENLKEYNSHTNLGDRITFIFPGGFIPRHTDKCSFDGYIHIRFNVFVQVPDMCETFYDDIIVDAKERHYVMCRSGIDVHWSKLNKGRIPRIALSFGFSLPIQKVTQLYKIPNQHYTIYRDSVLFKYMVHVIANISNIFSKKNYTEYNAHIPFLDIVAHFNIPLSTKIH